MRITLLKPCRKSMCAVYIDGEYALKLDMQTLQENHIAQGDTLTDEQLKMLIDQSDLRRAKEKALWLLSYRDHSKKELVDKMKRTCSQQAAQEAADRMEQLGLVDDRAFARRYACQLIYKKRLAPVLHCIKCVKRELTESLHRQRCRNVRFLQASSFTRFCRGSMRVSCTMKKAAGGRLRLYSVWDIAGETYALCWRNMYRRIANTNDKRKKWNVL